MIISIKFTWTSVTRPFELCQSGQRNCGGCSPRFPTSDRCHPSTMTDGGTTLSLVCESDSSTANSGDVVQDMCKDSREEPSKLRSFISACNLPATFGFIPAMLMLVLLSHRATCSHDHTVQLAAISLFVVADQKMILFILALMVV